MVVNTFDPSSSITLRLAAGRVTLPEWLLRRARAAAAHARQYTYIPVQSGLEMALKFPKLLIEELTSTKFGSNLIKLRRKTEFDQISKQARSENLGLTCVKSVHGHLS
jgi:hypothetical protein